MVNVHLTGNDLRFPKMFSSDAVSLQQPLPRNGAGKRWGSSLARSPSPGQLGSLPPRMTHPRPSLWRAGGVYYRTRTPRRCGSQA